jgi:hypothetical protein
LKRLRRQAVKFDFDGGTLASDGGLMLLRGIDQRLDLIRRIDQAIPDPVYTDHPQSEILTSRIFGIAAGYEDGNDHGTLRHDPAFQVAAGRTPVESNYDKEEHLPLASPSHHARPVTKLLVQKIRTRWPDVRITLRCDMENKIKEQQLFLFADRTSCTDFMANQFRLMLSSFAYVLMDGIRRIGLVGTKHSQLRVDTIRLKLIKIAGRIRVTCRRVIFHLSSHCPSADLFQHVLAKLCRSG